jgi:DNA-binding GntR family transcriptional regulator
VRAPKGLTSLPDNPTMAHLVAHRRFHASIYRASHNDRLIDTLEGLWDTADRCRRHGLQIGRSTKERADKATEHRLRCQAIIKGDAATAFGVMQAHIETSLGAKSAWRLAKMPTGSTSSASDSASAFTES